MNGWNLEDLFASPTYDVVNRDGNIYSVLIEHEMYEGNSTRFFAYVGIPEKVRQNVNILGSIDCIIPGVVCVHGGGGQAYREWVELWNKRGYAAISMDLRGNGPDGEPLPDGGPEQEHEVVFDMDRPWTDTWTYHAVTAVIRSHSLLRELPGVDAANIGLTGISWGGYLTCIAAGVDPRFRCSVPVYGCGFLQRNSAEEWMKAFEGMTPDGQRRWREYFDPSAYLSRAFAPMLFVTGTNDFAYPMDSLKMSYSLVPGPVSLCVRPAMPHGHIEGWSPVEIGMFMDSQLGTGKGIPRVQNMVTDGDVVRAKYRSAREVGKAYLIYTCDDGPWQDRKWHQCETEFSMDMVGNEYAGSISVTLPLDVTTYYLAVEDTAGALGSCPHECIR